MLQFSRRQAWSCLCITLLLALPSLATATGGAGLSFTQALELALQQAPSLQAARTQSEAARQASVAAGRLPDPMLRIGVDNLPIEGMQRFELDAEPMTMRTLGVMQEFPNRGKRQAQKQGAAAEIFWREQQADALALQLQAEVAAAWIERHALEAQIAEIEALAVENRQLDAAVRARFAAAAARPSETLLPRQEAALIEQRRDALLARREQAQARLRRWLGDVAERPLEGDPATPPPDADTLRAQLPQHPSVRALDAMAERVDAEIAAARADQRPDWALEFAYQQRAARFGDMAMLQVRIGLPLWQATRQLPRLAGKRSERAAVDAEIEDRRRELQASLEAELADYQRLQQEEARLQTVLLPLAEERIALELAAWRSGGGELGDLIAARRDRVELSLQALQLRGERQQLGARLHYAYGAEGAGSRGIR